MNMKRKINIKIKKNIILILQILTAVFLLNGCQNASVDEVQSQIEDTIQDTIQNKKDEVIAGAEKEAKNALVSQIESFFSDPELAGNLGISEEKKEELLQKLEETVQDYDYEASGIDGFQDQINSVLEQELKPQQDQEKASSDTEQEESEGLSVDQLKEQLQNAMTQFLGK